MSKSIKLCSIEGCIGVSRTRGWCIKHYGRWRTHGDPAAEVNTRGPRRSSCTVQGCDGRHEGHGYCRKHYRRWLKYGDPTKGRDRFQTPEESFLARAIPDGDCIIWVGHTSNGYGYIWVEDKDVGAHRYAWERVNGPVPDGMKVDHRYHCNTACVKVEHLRLATTSENNSNRKGPDANNKSSGIRNVRWDKNKRAVEVTKQGISYRYGRYDDLDEAAQVAEQARQEVFGEFAGKG